MLRTTLALLCLAALPLSAQLHGSGDPGQMRYELRVQALAFDNFFHASDPAGERDVVAFSPEIRVGYRPGSRPLEFFAHANVMQYDDDALDTSIAARAGARWDGARHDLRGWVEQAWKRPSFEVNNEFATVDVTTLALDYGWKFHDAFELTAEGLAQIQSVEADPERDNDYRRLGAGLRYRGLGYRFTPAAGYRTATRDVEDDRQSYDENGWWLGFETVPRDGLYFSVRYRTDDRDWTTADPLSSNRGRSERRGGWELVGDARLAKKLWLTAYYSSSDIAASIPSGDFDTRLLLVGLSWQF
jgi:hypothetical protein